MKPTEMTATLGNDQFYPTPRPVAEAMLADIDYRLIRTVLEPSAGKGDLISALAREVPRSLRGRQIGVDCCEIDPHLRQILKYEFSREKLQTVYDEQGRWSSEATALESVDVHVVHDDFLTFRTFKHYDLILMNPPFAEGARHLLRAIEMQKDGGSIICLLNAETIRNPYTAERKLLADQLDKYGADVQYIENAFADAERSADVDVAIVKLHFASEPDESTFWERMKKAVDEEADAPDAELQALVPGDYIEQAIQLYRTEVAATMAFVREYRALTPYIGRALNAKDSFDSRPILSLTVGDDNYIRGFDYQKYMRTVRSKYWRALFTNPEFIGRLTSEMQKRYQEQTERMADYEFSAFNIKQITAEMNASLTQGVEKAINDLFDKLTVEHSWYPECAANRHYFNGWATNKAHKIGPKCIIPTYGMFSGYTRRGETFDVSTAFKVISDIEKAFAYLDGSMADEADLRERLKTASADGRTRNIECRYFKIDLYKKGTTHIKFLPEAMRLVERLNIYAARNRGWLPPRYGKATYGRMSAQERAVVDSFHGDGGAGSGAKTYAKILSEAAYYLTDPVQSTPVLAARAE